VGIAERRERERTELRRKILDAARELFTSEGYERVTMRRIAQAIEYSPTAIYLHFQDKDALVQALCADEFARLLAALPARAPADPVEAIRRLGLAYARFGLAHPNHYRFMFMTEKRQHRLSDEGEQAFGLLRAAVERAVAAGRFRTEDVDTTAQVLWASLHGVVSLLATYQPEQFPHVPAAPDLVERVVENGIRGFLAEPASAPPAPRPRRARTAR
jgi:AcrR family transcriptional regulator